MSSDCELSATTWASLPSLCGVVARYKFADNIVASSVQLGKTKSHASIEPEILQWQHLSLVLFVPAREAPGWDGAAMPAQCEIAEPYGLLDLELQGWLADMRPWTPSHTQYVAIQEFSREAWGLLASSGSNNSEDRDDYIPPLLVAPLLSEEVNSCKGSCVEGIAVSSTSSAEHFAERSIDWGVVNTVAALRRSRARKAAGHLMRNCAGDSEEEPIPCGCEEWPGCRETLLQKSVNVFGSGSKSSATSNSYLDGLVIEGGDSGLLVVTTYNLHSYCIKRAWLELTAKDASLAPPRKGKQAPCPLGLGSLAAFYKNKLKVDVTDEAQCVMEAANGACVRPYACPSQVTSPRLSAHLCVESNLSYTKLDYSPPCLTVPSERPLEPGPIRLLPEFLVPHPFPRSLVVSLRLLPLLSCKVRRCCQLARLRLRLFDEFHLSKPACTKACSFRPFRARSEDGLAGSSLQVESILVNRLRHVCAPTTVEGAASTVELEWALDVAMTAAGACEPYEFGRLAWLGDTTLLLAAVTRVVAYSPRGHVSALKTIVGALVSNELLNEVAVASPLFAHNYLVTSPTTSKDLGKQQGSKKALATALEAVLAVALLYGGFEAADKLLGSLDWWSRVDMVTVGAWSIGSDDDAAFAEQTQARLRWIGYAAMQFHASAWLVSHFPQYTTRSLSDHLRILLSPSGLAAAITPERLAALEQLTGCSCPSKPPSELFAPASVSMKEYAELCVGLAYSRAKGLNMEGFTFEDGGVANISHLWTLLEQGWDNSLRPTL